MKICVMGHSGSGKSTLTKKISEVYQLPELHLDRVQFLPNWQVRPVAEGAAIVERFLQSEEEWVIDGNYSQYLQEERVRQADQIIFLLFPRIVCLKRVLQRYFRYRGQVRPDMAAGCDEKIDAEFFWWVLYKMGSKKKRQARQAIIARYPEKVTIIKNQRQLDRFVQSLGRSS